MATKNLTPRGRERRAQLIAYATTLFATQGYHPTSVADIVDGLGVGKGVFYWYFESKEELFIEILRTSQKELRRRQLRDIAESGNAVQRIADGVRSAVHWSGENRELFQLFEFAQTDERFAGAVRAGRQTLVGDAVSHVKDAIAEGLIPDNDPEQLAHAILGVSTILTSEYLHHRHADPDQIADSVVQFCLGGIGALPNR